jgi:hypothetical protein
MLNELNLDLWPDYIPFERQATKSDGTKINPTVATVSIYEEGGADATFDNVQITGSPFTCSIINAKVGNYGVLVDKSLFTVGKIYRVLYEWTVDGITTAAEENYLMKSSAVLVDAIWDEVLSGATHNVKNSSGRRLREIGRTVIWEGTCQGSGTGSNQIQLDAGASSIDDIYDQNMILILDGTGTGQTRTIMTYDGTTKIATINKSWDVLPVSGSSEFVLIASNTPLFTSEGKIQAATISTVTLDDDSSGANDAYLGSNVVIVSGTGLGQSRLITGYVGSTKIATITPNWTTLPDTTSAYSVIPVGRSIVDSISTAATDIIIDAVWDEGKSGHVATGSFGKEIQDIKTKTDNLPTDPTSETNATSNKTEILTEIQSTEKREVQEA